MPLHFATLESGNSTFKWSESLLVGMYKNDAHCQVSLH